jgi:hypothetical protein
MDWLLTLPGGHEADYWRAHATRQRLQLADTLGLCFGLLLHAAVLYAAVNPLFKQLLVLTLLGQLAHVSGTCEWHIPRVRTDDAWLSIVAAGARGPARADGSSVTLVFAQLRGARCFGIADRLSKLATAACLTRSFAPLRRSCCGCALAAPATGAGAWRSPGHSGCATWPTQSSF